MKEIIFKNLGDFGEKITLGEKIIQSSDLLGVLEEDLFIEIV